MTRIEYEAEWWLPSHPNLKVSGRLSHDLKIGLSLRVLGNVDLRSLADTVNLPVLLGRSIDGKDLTLLQLAWRGTTGDYSQDQNAIKAFDFSASIAFVGAHLPTSNDRRFSVISAQYTYLSEWALLGFTTDDGQSEEPVNARILASSQNISSTGADNGVEIQIRPLRSTAHSLTPSGATKHVSTTSAIVLKSTTPRTFEEWQVLYLHRIQDFLTFCVGKPSALESISTTTFLPGRNLPIKVTILLSYNRIQQLKENVQVGTSMLLPLSDFRERLSVVLSNWFSLYGPLDSLLQLHLLGEYSQVSFPFFDLRLVTLVQALESYHRTRHNEPQVDPVEWKARVDRITMAVDVEDGAWAKAALQWSNEQTLHQRLIKILDLTEPLSSQLVEDRSSFLSRIKNTRNYFSHYDTRLESKRLKGLDLFRATNILVMLVEMILLKELGFDSDTATKQVMGTNRYNDRNTFEIVSWLLE